LQAARADALARQLKRMEGSRATSSSSLNRLRRENDALKGLLLELAADRQAAQARLSELQQKMADLASSSISGEVSVGVMGGVGGGGFNKGGEGDRGWGGWVGGVLVVARVWQVWRCSAGQSCQSNKGL
jgi:hypothetical protein